MSTVQTLSQLILGEFLGTFILILLGNGICASLNYNRMYAKNSGGNWTIVTIGWGLAVAMAVTVSLAVGGSGHLNPAFSLYALITGGFAAWWYFFIFVIAQLVGAFTAQMLLYTMNYKHIKETDLDVVRGTSCCAPNYSNKEGGMLQNVLYEFVGTCLLIGVIACFARVDALNAAGPIAVGLLVTTIGMSLGSVTGFAINPARDLAPRLAFFVLTRLYMNKKANMDWCYSWVPVVAPLLAGATIGLISFLVGLA